MYLVHIHWHETVSWNNNSPNSLWFPLRFSIQFYLNLFYFVFKRCCSWPTIWNSQTNNSSNSLMYWNLQSENTVALCALCHDPPIFWKPNLPLATESMLTYIKTVNILHPLSLRFSVCSWRNSLFSWVATLGRCDSRSEEGKREMAGQIPSQGALEAAFWLYEPLCAWASLWEFLLFFHHEVMTNTNTVINKTCKQITNVMNLMSSYMLKAILISVPFFFFCILKPFPSVIP